MLKRVFGLAIAAALLLLLGLAGCGQGATPAPTAPPATHTPAPTAIAPATATASPSPTRTSTAMPRPTPPSAPVGQIVFGAYPCASETDCAPYPGMEQDFALYIINTDGTDMRPLTGEELRARELLVHLPFVPDELVKRAEEEGHFQRDFSVLPLFSYNHIRWLPDSSAWLEPGEDGLYLIQIDGTGATRLVEGQIYYYDLSPDGNTIAYVRDNGIYTRDVAGSNQRKLVQIQMPLGADIRWSPGGDQILVSIPSSGLSRPADLYLITPESDGEQLAQHIFHTGQWLNDPHWSPDGQRIEFSLCDRETNTLLSISSEGWNEQLIAQITDLSGCICWSAWSPDRTQLVFAPSLREGMYVLDASSGYYWPILSGYVAVGPMLWLPEPEP